MVGESRRPRILALVVTFDAPEPLVACLRGIHSQTTEPDGILVVDNASQVPAQDVLARAGLANGETKFLRLPENLGPAGGYAAGLGRLAGSRYDAAWVMDDDCVPDPGCLSGLVHRYRSAELPTLFFPRILDEQGVITNYPAWSGVLISRAIVQAVGVPKEEFFWWAEDTEYLQWRIPRAGYDVVRVSTATVTHGRARPRRRAAWKYYYEARNFVYYRVHIQGQTGLKSLLPTLTRLFLRILAIEDCRAMKLRLLIRGYRDGMAARLGRTIPVRSRGEAVHWEASRGA